MYFLFGFTPCKNEQPLRGIELKEKEEENDIGKLLRKGLKKERFLLTLDSKPPRS